MSLNGKTTSSETLKATTLSKNQAQGSVSGTNSMQAQVTPLEQAEAVATNKNYVQGKPFGSTQAQGNVQSFVLYKKGDKGDSAYDIAVQHGFKGTEEEWLDFITGKTPYIQDGYWYIDGVNTNIKAEGKDGKDGKNYTLTNYDIARIAEVAAKKHDTSHLQSKTDERLETTSKEIVGAINELASDGSIQTWVLYDDLERASGFDYEFNFTSNGVSYIGMEGTIDRFVDINGESYEGFRVVYNKSDGSGTEVYDGFVSGWKDTAYQTIVTTDTEVYDKVYDRTLSISQALEGIANKKPTGLNTKSQTLVGAINEVNEKIVENADSFEEKVSKTNFGKWISGFVGNAVDFVTALVSKITDVIKNTEIDTLEVEEGARALSRNTKTVVGAINALNDKVNDINPPEIDTSNLATVDKITHIDTYYGDNTGVGVNEVGVCWEQDFFIDGDDISVETEGKINLNVPIVAGKNVEFEVDSDNQVVKVNATGGGGANIILSNLAGATYKLNDIIEGAFSWNIGFTSNGTYYNSMSGSMTLDIYTVNYDSTKVFRTRNGDGTSTWTNTAYQYVEISGGADETNPEAIEWFNTHGKLLSVDLSNLATVDKVAVIDEWYGNWFIDDCSGEGIAWVEQFAFLDDSDNELKVGDMFQRIPIVAGNNVEFEVDEENQVIKINATGGGSAPSDDSIVGTWVFNDVLLETFTFNEYIDFTVTQGGQTYYLNQFIFAGNMSLYGSSGDFDDVYDGEIWTIPEFKTITFLSDSSNPDFLPWLKENATKQVEEPPYIKKLKVELTGSEMVTDIIAKMVDAGYELGQFAIFEFNGANSGTYGLTIQHYGGNYYNIGGIDFSTFYSMANQVMDWSTVILWSFVSMFQPPIPYCDDSNNGQVLKVVNGVPTWV